jgi:hypothetical protein
MQKRPLKITAKDIEVRPIEKKFADRVIKRVHYSGKVVNNSQLSLIASYLLGFFLIRSCLEPCSLARLRTNENL